jgi:hypothetical protein
MIDNFISNGVFINGDEPLALNGGIYFFNFFLIVIILAVSIRIISSASL